MKGNLVDMAQRADARSSAEYRVKVERCAYPPHLSGQYAMRVGPESLMLTSLKAGAQGVRFECPWSQVGELTEELLCKGAFSMDVGQGGSPSPVHLRLVEGDAYALLRFFDSLPAEVWLAKCLKCSGPVVDDVCRGCGTNRRLTLRKRGMTMVIYGAGMLVLFVGLAIFGLWLLRGAIVVAVGGLGLGFLLITLGVKDIYVSFQPAPGRRSFRTSTLDKSP